MFAADTKFDVAPGFPPFLHRNSHQLTDAFLINRRERISFYDFELGVMWQERSAVIATHSQSSLSEIICAETEKFGGARDFISDERAARNLDHGANQVIQ